MIGSILGGPLAGLIAAFVVANEIKSSALLHSSQNSVRQPSAQDKSNRKPLASLVQEEDALSAIKGQQPSAIEPADFSADIRCGQGTAFAFVPSSCFSAMGRTLSAGCFAYVCIYIGSCCILHFKSRFKVIRNFHDP